MPPHVLACPIAHRLVPFPIDRLALELNELVFNSSTPEFSLSVPVKVFVPDILSVP